MTRATAAAPKTDPTPAARKAEPAKPALTVVEATTPPPLTGAARVRAKIAEAEREARDLIEDYAACAAALAAKANEVAALGKYAPGSIVTSATALSKTLESEAMTVRAALKRGA